MKELAEYLRARGETRTRGLLLGGYLTLGFYGVEYLDALRAARVIAATVSCAGG